MSQIGSLMDALAAHARVVLGLSVDDARVERGIVAWQAIPAESMPHGMIHNYRKTQRELEHQQVGSDVTIGVAMIVDVEQEAAIGIGEAFEARIKADPTLGGLVQYVHVAENDLGETADVRKVLDLVVSVRWEV